MKLLIKKFKVLSHAIYLIYILCHCLPYRRRQWLISIALRASEQEMARRCRIEAVSTMRGASRRTRRSGAILYLATGVRHTPSLPLAFLLLSAEFIN